MAPHVRIKSRSCDVPIIGNNVVISRTDIRFVYTLDNDLKLPPRISYPP